MEDQRYLSTTSFDRRLNRNKSSGIGRRKKVKSVLHNVRYQIKKVAKGKNAEGYYSDDHNKDPTVIEHSLSRYQKNVSEKSRQQKKHRKNLLYKQGRDDDELPYPSIDADEIRSSIATSDDVEVEESNEVVESLFNPFNWVLSMASPQEECIDECEKEDENEIKIDNEDIDDHREAEGEEGYQADQEREHLPDQEDDEEENGRVFTRRQRKQSFKRRTKTSGGKTQQETEITFAESEQRPFNTRSSLPPHTTFKSSVEQQSRSILRSSSRSSKAIFSSAKKASNLPVQLLKTSSKLLVSNAIKASKSTSTIAIRSSKAITNGAQKSSRAISHSFQKTSKTSKELVSSIKRMSDANQKKAASALLLKVHSMMQKPEEFKTPGLLLNSIHTLIRDTESNATRSRRLISFRARRQSNRQSKATTAQPKEIIEYGIEPNTRTLIIPLNENTTRSKLVSCRARRLSYRQSRAVKYRAMEQSKKKPQAPDEDKDRADTLQQVHSDNVSCANTIISAADLSLDRSISEDETVISAYSNTYHSEYYTEAEDVDEEEYYSEDSRFTDIDWDDRTRNSETSAYYTTDFSDWKNPDESDIEIEGLTLYSDFVAEDIVSEESVSEETNIVGSTTGLVPADVDTGKPSTIEYADTDIECDENNDDDDDDDVSCILSDHDQAILDMIENDLEQLEYIHENEREGWLYQTFFPED